jgi:DNA primase
MGERRIYEWETTSEKYTEDQVANILNELAIDVVEETTTNYLCLCPFHGNSNSPALSVSKTSGLWMCFNPSCEKTGNMLSLVKSITNLTDFPAIRMIKKFKAPDNGNAYVGVKNILNRKKDFPQFSQEVVDRMVDDFWKNQEAIDYMLNRGFNEETLRVFSVGFSEKKQLVVIPMHDYDGNPVGVIGRSIVGKTFDNSKKLPTSRTLFNIHRAKKISDRLIIVESSMDALRLTQAGFPCVVALCGGFFTDYHIEQINKYFSTVIIATDFDDINKHKYEDCKKCENKCMGHNPGRVLGEKISNSLKNKTIKWAAFDDGVIYPHNAKDPGELSDSEIKKVFSKPLSSYQYDVDWKKNYPELFIM